MVCDALLYCELIHLRFSGRNMNGHGSKFTFFTFNSNAVFFSKFILETFMYIADTDFTEEIGTVKFVQLFLLAFPRRRQ